MNVLYLYREQIILIASILIIIAGLIILFLMLLDRKSQKFIGDKIGFRICSDCGTEYSGYEYQTCPNCRADRISKMKGGVQEKK